MRTEKKSLRASPRKKKPLVFRVGGIYSNSDGDLVVQVKRIWRFLSYSISGEVLKGRAIVPTWTKEGRYIDGIPHHPHNLTKEIPGAKPSKKSPSKSIPKKRSA